MWTNTRLSELFRIKYPVIQAPMAGGATTPHLVAAVSNSGGLGSLGAAYLSPGQLRQTIQEIRSLTGQPFGVNLFIPAPPLDPAEALRQFQAVQALLQPYRTELGLPALAFEALPPDPDFNEQLQVVLDERVPVFSFTFGVLAADWLDSLHSAGIKVAGTATTVQEACLLEEAGVDAVVGQGSEAGGHRGTFRQPVEHSLVSTLALIPQIVDNVRIPVIASGGIMDGRGIVAALALGAQAAQLGTAFLACPESGLHPAYKAALLASTEEDTFITRAFSGKAARGLRNRFSEELAGQSNLLPQFPLQNALTRDMRQAAGHHNNTDMMSLWAGQATRLCTNLPAARLMAELVSSVDRTLKLLS